MSRRLYAVLAVLIVAAVMLFVNLYYTAHEQGVADRRWCDLLASLDQPETPPTTERGRQVQIKLHGLRHRLGCSGS